MKPRVSIVIPAYNEGGNIEDVIGRLIEAVQMPSEMVVVVDSPDDTTVPYVEKYATKNPNIRCLVNDIKPGPAQAIRYGIDRAVADVAVVLNMLVTLAGEVWALRPLPEPSASFCCWLFSFSRTLRRITT